MRSVGEKGGRRCQICIWLGMNYSLECKSKTVEVKVKVKLYILDFVKVETGTGKVLAQQIFYNTISPLSL